MEDAPSFLEESLKACGIEFNFCGGEAFADLAGDGEENIGYVYVGHDEVFAGVEIDDVKALVLEIILEFS